MRDGGMHGSAGIARLRRLSDPLDGLRIGHEHHFQSERGQEKVQRFVTGLSDRCWREQLSAVPRGKMG